MSIIFIGMSLMTPEQCRMARAALDWSRSELAERAGVGHSTIADFESGRREPYAKTILDIQECLERAGIIFLSTGDSSVGPGVSFADPQMQFPLDEPEQP